MSLLKLGQASNICVISIPVSSLLQPSSLPCAETYFLCCGITISCVPLLTTTMEQELRLCLKPVGEGELVMRCHFP